MSYTTEADVRAVTGLTDASKVSSARILLKMAGADSIINGKIATTYQLPLSADCPQINFFSLEMTSLMLMMDIYGEESEGTDKGWQKRLNSILKMLDEIRDLKTILVDVNGQELTRNTVRQPSFYPTDASSDPAATNSTEPKLQMNQKF